jgi:hypothetical protein
MFLSGARRRTPLRNVARATFLSLLLTCPGGTRCIALNNQILAFYYGWWGNPAVSAGWRHWKDVDPANGHIANSGHFPAWGAYDSHDPALLDRQAAAAKAAAITGFIASWWGRDSFEDRGMAPLLAAAGKHGLTVSAYYEKVTGDDPDSRTKCRRRSRLPADPLFRRQSLAARWRQTRHLCLWPGAEGTVPA